MIRPLSVLVAAAIAVSTLAGATAANASTGSPAALGQAAAQARTNASVALGGIALPTAATTQLRAAAASTKTHVESVDLTMRVKVKAKRYDLKVASVGPKTDPTRIQLFLGTKSTQISIRRLVRITVIRHGYKHPLLETTTTFRRFVVMARGLAADPLTGTQTHFETRSAFVAALAHGLAIDSAQVTREYGAVLRFAQMSLDLSMTLLRAAEYAADNPSATDFSAVPTTQTTAGSGGYTGTVTLAGTPSAFSVTATNTTDASSLSESFDQQSLTITYTVGGKTYSRTF